MSAKVLPVRITLPNGTTITSDDNDLNQILSKALDRQVTFGTAQRAAVNAEERAMTVERVRLDEVDDLVADGRIVDAKSIVGLLLTRRYLGGEFDGFRG